jgi:hypothetical protein
MPLCELARLGVGELRPVMVSVRQREEGGVLVAAVDEDDDDEEPVTAGQMACLVAQVRVSWAGPERWRGGG